MAAAYFRGFRLLIAVAFALSIVSMAAVAAPPLVWHPANEIMGGTFPDPSYIFSQNLTVNGSLFVNVSANIASLIINNITSCKVLATDSEGNVFCGGSGAGGVVGGEGNGSATEGYIPRWNGTYTLTNSVVYQNGSNVGIGTTNPVAKLDVVGGINIPSSYSYMMDNQTFISYILPNSSIKIGMTNPYVQSQSVLIGIDAGFSNRGNSQTAVGYKAGMYNNGNGQTAYGYFAGSYNLADYQTVMGYFAGSSNNAMYQTAVGFYAGYSNSGIYQTAFGTNAGYDNSGNYQTAVGYKGGFLNSGNYQTSLGMYAGYQNSGDYQTAIGINAGYYNYGDYQVVIGYNAGHSNRGNYTIGIGYDALSGNNGNHVIAIGNGIGKYNTANNIFIIGDSFVSNIPLVYGNLSSGNFGIATTSPQAKLDVNGSAVVRGNLDMASNRITNLGEPTTGSDAATKNYVDNAVNEGTSSAVNGTPGYIAKFTSSNSVGDSSIFENETSGFVGIGTSLPSGRLHVATSGDLNALVVDDSTGSVGIGVSNPSSKLSVSGNLNVTSSGTALILDSSGNVVIHLG